MFLAKGKQNNCYTEKGCEMKREKEKYYPTEAWLRSKGFVPARMPYHSPFEFLVNNKRVVVKEANRASNQMHWRLNIHRHGKVDESEVDVYLFRLLDVPGFSSSVYLMMPAPIGAPSVTISLRSLIQRYAKYVDNIEPLKD